MSSDSSPPPRRPRLPSVGSDDVDSPGPSLPSFPQSSSQAPVLRQAVGFSWNVPSTGINTYSASVPGVALPQLPSQSSEPPQPDPEKPKKDSRSREPGSSRTKSRKGKAKERALDTPTGSRAFRVDGYSNEPSPPGPSQSPPRGPYRSDYRAEGSPPVARASGKGNSRRPDNRAPPSAPSSQVQQTQRPPRRYEDPRGEQFHSQPVRVEDYSSQASPFYAGSPSSTTITESHSPERSQRTHRSHSRNRRSGPSDRGHNSKPSSSQAAHRNGNSRSLRILTLLIEDLRPGQTESQLAEVKVPLRPAENLDDGFWADAKEVCEDLQASPSRIDGPAKVYATRGKYKQCFLRVTADGVDEWTSANLKVNPDRTLDIEVQDNPSLPLRARSSFSRGGHMLTPVTDTAPTPTSVATPQPMVPFNMDRFSPGLYDDEPSRPTVPRKRRRSRSPTAEASRSQNPRGPESTPYHTSPYASHVSISQRSSDSREGSLVSQQISTGSQNRSSQSFSASHRSSETRDSAGAHLSPASHTSQLSRRSPTSYASPPSERHPGTQASFSPPTPSPVMPSPAEPEHIPSPRSYLPGPSAPKKPRHPTSTIEHDTARRSAQPHSYPSGAGGSSTTAPSPIAPAAGFGSYSQGSGAFGFGASFSQSQPSGARSSQPSLPSRQPPVAPIEQNPAQDALDNKVGLYLRGIFMAEPGWTAFVEARRQVLPMSTWLEHCRYVQDKFDTYVGRSTPADLEDASSVRISRAQVIRAFNLQTSWGDDCSEMLELTSLYGPKAKRYKDPEVVEMWDEVPPITTGMQAKRYLALLREVHARWVVEHPET